MRRRRRNKLDIYADILTVAKEGAQKTHLVGKANLNFRLILPYLRTLIDRGLMSAICEPFKTRYTYQTTPRGIEFLDHYRAIIQAIEAVEERPSSVIALRN